MEEEKNLVPHAPPPKKKVCAMSRDHAQRRNMSLNRVIRPACPPPPTRTMNSRIKMTVTE